MRKTVFDRLKEAAGPKGFSEDAREIAPHLEEWRGKYHGRASLLLKPSTTAQTAAILAICHETGTAIVPQGGNTGLVGAQIPFHDEVLLSTARLNRIRALDTGSHAITVEAGATLAAVQAAAAQKHLLFPLSLASEGSCTIGGNLSTNAGGVHVLRYGMMRDLVLGLEVVLADGRILETLRTLRKDNTGYDLKQLFIGAEGTLGVITAAALKLFPQPRERMVAFVALPGPQAAVALLGILQARTGGQLSAFELMPRIALELVLRHIPHTSDPLSAPAPWYVLIETHSGAPLGAILEEALAGAIAEGLATDGVVAASESQALALWRLRESISAAQKHEGASIKHDVSVPIAAIPDFLTRATQAVLGAVPGARPVSFGHVGDGNLHFNFSMPPGGDTKAFLARWEDIQRIVHDIVHEFHGSISAEHGIGVMKRGDLARYKSHEELDVMRSLKSALDPKNILNPGKLIPQVMRL
jgi:FAD/FMN-containing dehydrogenase